jgi:hypothetical protein
MQKPALRRGAPCTSVGVAANHIDVDASANDAPRDYRSGE